MNVSVTVDSIDIMEQLNQHSIFNLAYNMAQDYLLSLSILDWLKICTVCNFLFFVVLPTLKYWTKYIYAVCKPIKFPYQHVLITGCGTGLGRCLVQGVFTRGAVVTMIGKD